MLLACGVAGLNIR